MRHLTERYEAELKVLERELRIELPKEIERATALGDLRENAEYHAALDRQRLVQARIGQIKERLSQLATVRIAQIPNDKAAFGSLVDVEDLDSDEERSFELVFGEDGDPQSGRISIGSPIGRALTGKQVGDEVVVRTPSGERTLVVVGLKTLHERESEEGEESDDGGSA